MSIKAVFLLSLLVTSGLETVDARRLNRDKLKQTKLGLGIDEGAAKQAAGTVEDLKKDTSEGEEAAETRAPLTATRMQGLMGRLAHLKHLTLQDDQLAPWIAALGGGGFDPDGEHHEFIKDPDVVGMMVNHFVDIAFVDIATSADKDASVSPSTLITKDQFEKWYMLQEERSESFSEELEKDVFTPNEACSWPRFWDRCLGHFTGDLPVW